MLRFPGTDQFCLSPVARNLPAFEISFLHQPFHMDGYQIRLDPADLYNICGIFILRIIFQEHQDIQGCLRNAGLLA